ncbi:Hypothetical predicted protein, partial [Marmota monax]
IEKTEEIHHQFQQVLTEISKLTNDYELNLANRLFGEKTFLFLQKYLDYVEKYYHASLEPVDFINEADESRKKINSWVESQTNGRVWNTSKSVWMMEQHHSFSFVFLEDLEAKIVGIPYKNNDLSMFVLLLNDLEGLEK